jgi:hypothetical protein
LSEYDLVPILLLPKKMGMLGQGNPLAVQSVVRSIYGMIQRHIFYHWHTLKEPAKDAEDFSCTCWNLLSVARRPTRVNSDDKQGYMLEGNSSVDLASHGHCAGVFIGT